MHQFQASTRREAQEIRFVLPSWIAVLLACCCLEIGLVEGFKLFEIPRPNGYVFDFYGVTLSVAGILTHRT